MSLISWPKRHSDSEYYDEFERQQRIKLPPDLEQDLARALDEPFGAPARTAQTIAAEIEHLRDELTNARELVKRGEAKEATLVAELTAAVDEEIAAKKATHETEVAELESLRPAAEAPAP
jgi:hypothetical protein